MKKAKPKKKKSKKAKPAPKAKKQKKSAKKNISQKSRAIKAASAKSKAKSAEWDDVERTTAQDEMNEEEGFFEEEPKIENLDENILNADEDSEDEEFFDDDRF